jgi:GST-like protein
MDPAARRSRYGNRARSCFISRTRRASSFPLIPRDRYVNESKRILGVLDGQLQGRDWIVGDYSIADIAVFPWIWNVIENYKAGDILGIGNYANVLRVHAAFMARPAVQRGLKVPVRPS